MSFLKINFEGLVLVRWILVDGERKWQEFGFNEEI